MILGLDPAWTATVILIGVYVLILTEWINRAVIAMIAAGLMVQSAAPAYGGLEHIEPLWWALSLGACLGGNATLVPSPAGRSGLACPFASGRTRPMRCR